MKRVSWLVLATIVLLASPVLASHPERDDLYRLENLGRELKDATRHVHKSAKYYEDRDRRDYGQRNALRALYRLREAADEYECSIEESYGDFYRTEKSFRKLHYAFEEAQEAFYELYPDRHLRRDFDRVEGLVYELESFYGYDRRAGHKPYGKRHHPKIRLRIDWPW